MIKAKIFSHKNVNTEVVELFEESYVQALLDDCLKDFTEINISWTQFDREEGRIY